MASLLVGGSSAIYMAFAVYVLKSHRNGKHYVGMTSKDPQVRLKEHHAGSRSWTSRNGPFELIHSETFTDGKEAHKRELFLKSGVGRRQLKVLLKPVREGD